MAVRYKGYLETAVGSMDPAVVKTASFELEELYNAGWSAAVRLTAASFDSIALGNMFRLSVRNRVTPGSAATLHLALLPADEGDGAGVATDGQTATIVRAWPCVITEIEPLTEGRVAHCMAKLVDPVSYLASRPVWGAYRASPLGQIVGGALSLAAGGDGKPTLNPTLPGMPPVHIEEAYRPELNEVPYAIAAGQPLGQWLDDLLGMLGLRAEMFGGANGRVSLRLTDRAHGGDDALEMGVIGNALGAGSVPARAGPSAARLAVKAIVARPAGGTRGGLLDDPTLGGFRYFGRRGGLGSLQTGAEIGVDEAGRRAGFAGETARAEMVMLEAGTGQPGFRPGRLARLDQSFLGFDTWQFGRVRHELHGNVYANDGTLMPAAASWHPPPPPVRSPRFVGGMVDGGLDEYLAHEPIPRDRLGRIPVSLAFTPTPVGLEAAFDTNFDRRITLDDFTDEEIGDFRNNATAWEADEQRLRNGEFADPHPGRNDDELEPDELQERNELRDKRTATLKYIAYQQAADVEAADHDSDGYVSMRDASVSNELSAILADPEQRTELERQWASYKAGTIDQDFTDPGENAAVKARTELLKEYGRLFDGTGPEGDPNLGLSDAEAAEYSAIRHDADVADEIWPPRIPLTVIEPMAGGLHGFIPGHRQGDICRVAVHHPLHAEIVGFQYRSNRRINQHLLDSTAGLVVEHLQSAWSGVVFRPTEELEGEGTTH